MGCAYRPFEFPPRGIPLAGTERAAIIGHTDSASHGPRTTAWKVCHRLAEAD
jgi:hypothetical protein